MRRPLRRLVGRGVLERAEVEDDQIGLVSLPAETAVSKTETSRERRSSPRLPPRAHGWTPSTASPPRRWGSRGDASRDCLSVSGCGVRAPPTFFKTVATEVLRESEPARRTGCDLGRDCTQGGSSGTLPPLGLEGLAIAFLRNRRQACNHGSRRSALAPRLSSPTNSRMAA